MVGTYSFLCRPIKMFETKQQQKNEMCKRGQGTKNPLSLLIFGCCAILLIFAKNCFFH